MVCVETRHMQAVLKAQINKTDRNDARGMAQMMRVGLYRPVHVKTLRSQKLRMLLTHRQLLQSKAIAIENDLRGTLRNFGLKVGMVGKVKFEARVEELVESLPDLAGLVEPLLIVRRVLREQLVILHRRLLAIVRDDEVCRRLMTTPGVGPVVALTYRATVDVPARLRKSRAVGAVFGLTCSKYQSGEIDRSGRISRCGDEMMRVMLYEAAQSMLRSKKWSWLKAWAMQIARRRGIKKAIVALARRLAVIMHRIWIDGTEFRWTREQVADRVYLLLNLILRVVHAAREPLGLRGFRLYLRLSHRTAAKAAAKARFQRHSAQSLFHLGWIWLLSCGAFGLALQD